MNHLNCEFYCHIPGDEYLHVQGKEYIDSIIKIAQYAELYHYTGALIYYNHTVIDPWILASIIIQNTETHIPLIALQPYTMPPVTAAKMIQSINWLFNRKVNLNMVTGARKKELNQINDFVDHNERYVRLHEYIEVLNILLNSKEPVTYHGKYYNYKELQLKPICDKFPEIFVAGSSEYGNNVGRSVGKVLVTHPGPIEEYKKNFCKTSNGRNGIRLGVIARWSTEEAWKVAKQRYPPSRIGMIQTKMKTNSESHWIKYLSELSFKQETIDDVFWLGGFLSGHTSYPIIIGSYKEVADYLKKYIEFDVSVVLLSGVFTQEEFENTSEVIKLLDLQSKSTINNIIHTIH